MKKMKTEKNNNGKGRRLNISDTAVYRTIKIQGDKGFASAFLTKARKDDYNHAEAL